MTDTPSPQSGIPDKLLAAPRVKLRLAALSMLILAAGALMAPAQRSTGLTPPQEHAAPLLEEQKQPRAISIPFRGVEEIARQVRQHSVAIAPRHEQGPATFSDFDDSMPGSDASGFGVFVSETFVLTHVEALDGRAAVQITAADGAVMDGQVAAYEPSTQIVLLRTQSPVTASAPLSAVAAAPGALAVAVGRWSGRDISVPVFITSMSEGHYTLSDASGALRAGMPLFTVDGELFAIAGRDEGGAHAFAVRDAAARLIARASSGTPLASFGICVQEPAEVSIDIVGGKGVLISEVVEGGPASEVDIRAGDLLLAVGPTEVGSAETAARALQSAAPRAPTELRIVRDGRVRTIQVTSATAYEVAVAARAARVLASTLPEARVLFTAAQLESARIPPSARVVSIGGRNASSRTQLQRQLRGAKQPVLVLLRHGDRQFFASIATTR